MALPFLIARVAHAINERMARRIDYLLEEVRVLQEAYTAVTGCKRVPFTDDQRRRLAIRGRVRSVLPANLQQRNQVVQVFGAIPPLLCSGALCPQPLRAGRRTHTSSALAIG
ncbi:hypothetical protein ACFL5O_09810 [Myxococcota bacterium]